jgi:hypothetical protein
MGSGRGEGGDTHTSPRPPYTSHTSPSRPTTPPIYTSPHTTPHHHTPPHITSPRRTPSHQPDTRPHPAPCTLPTHPTTWCNTMQCHATTTHHHPPHPNTLHPPAVSGRPQAAHNDGRLNAVAEGVQESTMHSLVKMCGVESAPVVVVGTLYY